ncbi:Fc.00g017310.m01.CDS01 [Cosmosporella sp. VM-42]
METSLEQQSEEDQTRPSPSEAPSGASADSDATLQAIEQTGNEITSNTAPPSQPVVAPKAAVCGVCNVNAPKYKCPRCYLPYCSVACNKSHRENHPPDPEPKPEQKRASDAQSNAPAQPCHPTSPFRALEKSDKLRHLFKKYPGLPDQLLRIHAATLPPTDAASQNPGIPASLLKGLPKKESWNHDIGIQNGKEALRKARRADGEEGDAIREYSELILHLTNTGGSDSDVTNLLRQQLAREDTRLIERLMAEEKR